MPASKQELLKDTNGEYSPNNNAPVIEAVSFGSSSFTRLKKEMYISDDYEAELRDLIKQKKAVVLAVEAGGRYVGRVTLRHDWGDETSIIEKDFPGLPQINALEIDEDYRRRGLATMLIAAAENEARRQGFSMIGLGVEISNEPAKKLYEKLGYSYQQVGGSDTYDFLFGKPNPQVYKLRLMTKSLQTEANHD
ncbi:MAG: GNAT family N-acetyltransferase [Candidatus Nanosynbacter sp.]|nr:GNAT family N-acetyltransferase [Candidatus Nanosynbacter sp.]